MKYEQIYNDFINEFEKSGVADAETIGGVIVRLAHSFMTTNAGAVQAEQEYNKKYAEMIVGTDAETGKPISAAKAEVLARATDQYLAWNVLRKDLEVIETLLNALKAQQKGVLKEYGNSGLS